MRTRWTIFHKIILSINTNLQAKHMVSLQNLPGSLDTTDLPSWVIAKLGFAVLSWEIQCLSSALYLSESNWDLPAPEECLCQWDMGCFGSEHFAVCPGGFSVYVEKPWHFEWGKINANHRITKSLKLAGTIGGLWSKPLTKQGSSGLLRALYSQGIKTSKNGDGGICWHPPAALLYCPLGFFCLVLVISRLMLHVSIYDHFLSLGNLLLVQGLLLGAPEAIPSPG